MSCGPVWADEPLFNYFARSTILCIHCLYISIKCFVGLIARVKVEFAAQSGVCSFVLEEDGAHVNRVACLHSLILSDLAARSDLLARSSGVAPPLAPTAWQIVPFARIVRCVMPSRPGHREKREKEGDRERQRDRQRGGESEEAENSPSCCLPLLILWCRVAHRTNIRLCLFFATLNLCAPTHHFPVLVSLLSS